MSQTPTNLTTSSSSTRFRYNFLKNNISIFLKNNISINVSCHDFLHDRSFNSKNSPRSSQSYKNRSFNSKNSVRSTQSLSFVFDPVDPIGVNNNFPKAAFSNLLWPLAAVPSDKSGDNSDDKSGDNSDKSGDNSDDKSGENSGEKSGDENFEYSRRTPWEIKKEKEEYIVKFDMPGMTEADVVLWVGVEENILVINAEKPEMNEQGYERYRSRIPLPQNIEIEKIKAEVKVGVLYVTIPKTK